MASKTTVTLVDDLTGEEGDDIQTVEYGLDGVTYEIDLSEKNAKDLREELQAYITASRRVGGRQKRGAGKVTTKTSGSGYSRETLASMRAWARGEGYEVSPRGRIPSGVVQAWEEAHQGSGERPQLAAVGS